MSVSSAATDMRVRYERVTQEYAKLCKQAVVLKQGVKDERAKNEKLTNELQVKESALRKLQSENEAIQYRNDQLKKRCETLQEDVQLLSSKVANKSKNKQSKDALVADDLNNKIAVLEEEIMNRMRQQELLETKARDLEEQMEKLKLDLAGASGVNTTLTTTLNTTLNTTLDTTLTEGTQLTISTDGYSVYDDDIGLEVDGVLPLKFRDYPEQSLYQLLQRMAKLSATFLEILAQRIVLHPFDETMEQVPEPINKFAEALYTISTRIKVCLESLDEENFVAEDVFKAIHSVQAVINEIGLQKMYGFLQFLIEKENRVPWCDWQEENGIWANAIRFFLEVLGCMDVRKMCSSSENSYQASAIINYATRHIHESFRNKNDKESKTVFMTKRLCCVNSAMRTTCEALHNCANVLTEDFFRNFPMSSISLCCPNAVHDETQDAGVQASNMSINAEAQINSLQASVAALQEEKQKNLGELNSLQSSIAALQQERQKNLGELNSLQATIAALQEEKKNNLGELEVLRFKVNKFISPTQDSQDEEFANRYAQMERNMELTTLHATLRISELENLLQKAQNASIYYLDEVKSLVRENKQVHAHLRDAQAAYMNLEDVYKCEKEAYENKHMLMSIQVAELEERVARKEQKDVAAVRGGGFGVFKGGFGASKGGFGASK